MLGRGIASGEAGPWVVGIEQHPWQGGDGGVVNRSYTSRAAVGGLFFTVSRNMRLGGCSRHDKIEHPLHEKIKEPLHGGFDQPGDGKEKCVYPYEMVPVPSMGRWVRGWCRRGGRAELDHFSSFLDHFSSSSGPSPTVCCSSISSSPATGPARAASQFRHRRSPRGVLPTASLDLWG